MKKEALIMVDLQNDFCAGGNLSVPQGDDVIPLANKLQTCFDLIIATQDWHPKNHTSFASNHNNFKIGDIITINNLTQILWPDHCIQGSKGAEFHPKLHTQQIKKIFHKGIDKNIDSYSAFFDNAHLRSTGLADYLKQENVKDIYIIGLATDYCVKYSVLDAVSQQFNVHVIIDACRGVELNKGDTAKAIKEMEEAGAHIVYSADIIG